MKKLTIEIELENDALKGRSAYRELRRIIGEALDMWDAIPRNDEATNLRDINGNTVGKLSFTNEAPR
jgi:hypothetical protein